MHCLFYKPKDGLLNSEQFPISIENGNMKLYVQKQGRENWRKGEIDSGSISVSIELAKIQFPREKSYFYE